MTALARRVPILAYHSIADGPPPLCVSPSRFAEHVASLHGDGWHTLTLDAFLAGHVCGGWPARSLMLTFDDGMESFAKEAVPRLVRVGYCAIAFIVSGKIGGATDWPGWPPGAPVERLLDARALVEVAAAGMEIGAHSVSHARLTGLAPARIAREILDSCARLEDVVGRPVRTFAYPFGDAPPDARRLVGSHFDAGFGIKLAYASAGSRLERLERIDAYYLRRRTSLASLSSRTTRMALAGRSMLREIRRRSGYGGYSL